MKWLGVKVAMLAMLLAGCSSTVAPELSQHYEPSESARIRLFGQNQKPTTMYVQAADEAAKPIKISVGGTMGEAFSSFLRVVKNQSLGMAATEHTRNLQQRDGILSKAFYREFVIPAGRPVKINNAFIGLSNVHNNQVTGMRQVTRESSCRSQDITFTPQAGKDYEVTTYADGHRCVVQVFELVGGGDGIEAVLVPVSQP
ncbi:hypothetical protein AB8Q18_10390 [Neisseriaceae bacterium CLB008]|nr:hypothetical protein [Neisseriaceae bacterium]